MTADEYHVYRQPCRTIKKDHLDVWRPVLPGDLPAIQIDQADGASAAVYYAPTDAPALAAAILEAAGLKASITLEGRP